MSRGILTVDALRARCTIDHATHCWLWQGALSTDGVPRLHTLDYDRGEKRTMSGPKAAWYIANGTRLPEWAQLVYRGCLHDQCLNPVHLRLARDRVDIGLHIRLNGKRKGTHMEQRRANVAKAQIASGHAPTPAEVVTAIRLAPKDVSSLQLSRQHGIAHQTVSRIRRGESHRHLLQDAPILEVPA